MKNSSVVVITLLTVFHNVFAQPTLPSVFSDHMVLQRDQPIPVWGTDDPGITISVEFADQKKTTTADEKGYWRVDLDAENASSHPRELIVSSSAETSKIIFHDVLVGDVWLCSGQSNMEMPLKGFQIPTEHADEVIAAATHPRLRFYKTPRVASGVPRKHIDSSWTECTPETAAGFSATAFYFGRKLQEELDVPVGLLLSAWGGTRIEPWTPPCGFENIDSLADIRETVKNIDPQLGTSPKTVKKQRQTPTAIYNGMLHAHIPFAIKGAIWYQGEANHNEGMLYVDKTKALLQGWRKLWGYDFPFYFVQIAPFKYGSQAPEILAEFWEAQSKIVDAIPGTGMAVINDCTMLDDIHPINKKAPGTRLALLALENTYGKDLVSTGPVFKSMQIDGHKIVVHFDSAKGLTTRDGKAPDWFEIGGEEGIFKPAKAEIKGSAVILESPEVPAPLAMRFAWSKLATPNLVNAAGLPASAFRAGRLPEPKLPELTQIPEMEGYTITHQLLIDPNANYATAQPEYLINNSAVKKPFSRIAYLLELQEAGGEIQYTFVAMDAFTDDLDKISVPTKVSGARFTQKVSGLTVRSNVPDIASCTLSDGGSIEFWPGNYGPKNTQQVPGATDRFDFGDTMVEKFPGYGCMQVHNWKAKQTLFAFNHWGNAGTVDLGIGNSTGKTADWTFTGNGEQFLLRRLTVMVK